MCPFGTDLNYNWQEPADVQSVVSAHAKCLDTSANAVMQVQKCQVSVAPSGIIKRQGKGEGKTYSAL